MAVTPAASSNDWMMKPSGITTDTAITGKDPSKMDMNDFFKLMVAQLTNQDMMNPTNDTEFIAQMAQFSALQGVQTIQEYQLSSYATSYVGKEVKIAEVDDNGDLKTIEGVVDAVSFYSGKPQVIVGGTAYDLYTVMEIVDNPTNVGGGNTNSGVSLSEASSFIGKYVEVEYKTKDENGEEITVKETGYVTSAIMKDGKAHIVIDGESHPAGSIQAVKEGPDDTRR